MAREKSNFESYSTFYENFLQQEHQLLYQKEQELLAVVGEQKKTENGFRETADMSHELIIEITALRAKLQDIEEESIAATDAVKKQVQEQYEALVRTLFATCISLKSKIDEYQISMKRQVTEIISEARKAAVDDMTLLKKKYGTLKVENESSLTNTLTVQEKLQSLRSENSQLQELVCKLKAMYKWKSTAREGQLLGRLRNSGKEATQYKKESLKLKFTVEKEVTLLRQQLMVARTALMRTQAEASNVKQQLIRQKQLFHEAEHRHSQEVRSRQQLDRIKSGNLDKLQEDIEEKEWRVRLLSEEAERSSKISQLKQAKIKKEVKQVKSQLIQERNLKLDAFQRVDELQTQVYDFETANSVRNSPGGLRKTSAPLLSRGTRSPSAVSSMAAVPPYFNQEEWDSPHYIPPAETKTSIQRQMRLQRPKTVPSRCRVPELSDSMSQAILTQLHELRLNTK